MRHTIPKGWEEKTLGEISISICNGTSAQQCKKITNYPVTRIETIATSKINLDRVGYINNCSEDFVNKYKMEYGDILFSNINSDIHLGKTAIYEAQEGILLHGMNLLNIRTNKSFVNPFYLNYYFIYLRFLGCFIKMASHSVNQSSINQKKLKTLKIFYPPLSEQKRIVAKLDKTFETIDKLKANAEKNLKNVRELFESSLNKLFTENTNGWEEKTLGEVCIIISGQSPKSQFYNTKSNGLPFYQGKKEFTDKYIGIPSIWTTKITKEALTGDILMSIRAPVGPINYAVEKCCIGRGLAAIRNSKILNKDFLFYYLTSLQRKISGHNGAVFNSISKNEIAKLKILFPLSLSDQQKIVNKLDKLQEKTKQLENFYIQKIQLLDELKQSILNKAFKGEL